MIASLAVQHRNPVVGRDEHVSVVWEIEIIDSGEPVAADFPQQRKIIAGNIVKQQAVASGADNQAAHPVEAAAAEDLPVRAAQRGEDFASAQQEQTPVLCHRGDVAASVRRRLARVVHLREGADLPEPVIERQNHKAVRGSDVVVPVRAAHNRPYGVGGEPVVLVDQVGQLLIDHNGKPVVVGPDPEASFLVHIEAVGVAHGIQAVHPAKFRPVVPVDARIGSDPENSVRRLGNVVGLSAGKAVAAAVDRLDIAVVAVVDGFGFAVPEGKQEPRRKQNTQRAPPARMVPGQVEALSAELQNSEYQKQRENREHLIQEVHIELADAAGEHLRKPVDGQELKHRVSEVVSRHSVVQQQIERHGHQDREQRRLQGDGHRPQKAVQGIVLQAPADHRRQCDAGQSVRPGDRVGERAENVPRHAHHRAADRSGQVGTEHRPEGIHPERQGQAAAKLSSRRVQQNAACGKKADLPGFPIFHAFRSPLRFPASRHSGHAGDTNVHIVRSRKLPE